MQLCGGKHVTIAAHARSYVQAWRVKSGHSLQRLPALALLTLTVLALAGLISPTIAPAQSGVPDREIAPQPKKPEPVLIIRGHQNPIHRVAFSPNGNLLASAARFAETTIWDAATGKEILRLDGGGGVAFDPVRNRCLNNPTGPDDVRALIWDLGDGKLIFSVNSLLLLDNSGANLGLGAYSPDGKTLVTVSAASYRGEPVFRLRTWDARSGKPLRTLPALTVAPRGLAVGADNLSIAVAFADKNIGLSGIGMESRDKLVGHTAAVNAVAFGPARTPKLVPMPDDPKTCKFLASASADKRVKKWDLDTREDVLTLTGHQDEVVDVAYSPNGLFIASASLDETVRIWNAADGKELLMLRAHTGGATSVAFSPNSQRLVSGGLDRLIKVWDLNRLLIP
jgi:WD40 repeat protein